MQLAGALPVIGQLPPNGWRNLRHRLAQQRWRHGCRTHGSGSGESSLKLSRVNARKCDVSPGAFEAPEHERSKQGLITPLKATLSKLTSAPVLPVLSSNCSLYAPLPRPAKFKSLARTRTHGCYGQSKPTKPCTEAGCCIC